ncbi:MAG TPA: hypothetical protein VF359_09565 [Anaerolineales bacterium]
MIKTSDLLHLPYTPDLTEGGISYACRSLVSSSNHIGGVSAEHLRQIVGGMSADLAFRRFLSENDIPFHVLGTAPFTCPDRYDVSLGGHRCELKSYLITRREQIARIRKDPAFALQAPALIPLDQFTAESHKPDDVYIFAFLLGVVAAAREEQHKAAAAGQPVCLIHPLPEKWNYPEEWHPLEKLALKSECEQPIRVEIGGLNEEPRAGTGTTSREFVTATLELPPKKRVPVKQSFYSLAYVHAVRRPEARIGLHSPSRGDAYIIPTHAWGNIWVYGMDIILTGWLTHEEYMNKSKVLNAGMHTFQNDRTRVKNMLVPMAELNPLKPLFARVRAWAGTSINS